MIVEKAVKMAQMMNIPIIGIIENMSYAECPDCGKHINIFGESHIEETAKQYSQIDNVGLLNEMASRIADESMSIMEQVRFEKEYLEYVTYVNPKMADYYYIVVDYKTYKDETKPYMTLRNIKTGEETKTRIKQSKIYKQQPFGEFSILKIEGFTMDFKKKLINGQWTSTDEQEPILEEYEVIKKQ